MDEALYFVRVSAFHRVRGREQGKTWELESKHVFSCRGLRWRLARVASCGEGTSRIELTTQSTSKRHRTFRIHGVFGGTSAFKIYSSVVSVLLVAFRVESGILRGFWDYQSAGKSDPRAREVEGSKKKLRIPGAYGPGGFSCLTAAPMELPLREEPMVERQQGESLCQKHSFRLARAQALQGVEIQTARQV